MNCRSGLEAPRLKPYSEIAATPANETRHQYPGRVHVGHDIDSPGAHPDRIGRGGEIGRLRVRQPRVGAEQVYGPMTRLGRLDHPRQVRFHGYVAEVGGTPDPAGDLSGDRSASARPMPWAAPVPTSILSLTCTFGPLRRRGSGSRDDRRADGERQPAQALRRRPPCRHRRASRLAGTPAVPAKPGRVRRWRPSPRAGMRGDKTRSRARRRPGA